MDDSIKWVLQKMLMDSNGHTHFTLLNHPYLTFDSLYWIIHISQMIIQFSLLIHYTESSIFYWWSANWIIYIYRFIKNILWSMAGWCPTVFCWNTCWRVLSTVGVKSWGSLGSGVVTSISTIVSASVASLGAHMDVCSEWKILVSLGREELI